MTITTQPYIAVNTGSAPNDGTGATIRDAFTQVNSNFSNYETVGIPTVNLVATGTIQGASFVVGNTYVPSTASATGTIGQISWDSGNIYVCVATNTWKRATLASW